MLGMNKMGRFAFETRIELAVALLTGPVARCCCCCCSSRPQCPPPHCLGTPTRAHSSLPLLWLCWSWHRQLLPLF